MARPITAAPHRKTRLLHAPHWPIPAGAPERSREAQGWGRWDRVPPGKSVPIQSLLSLPKQHLTETIPEFSQWNKTTTTSKLSPELHQHPPHPATLQPTPTNTSPPSKPFYACNPSPKRCLFRFFHLVQALRFCTPKLA